MVHTSMNHMEKQELKNLRHLSTLVGHFIRYWGFRKIHGEIWSVVYLAKTPLSGVEIGEILKVSKALISPALQELETEGLIKQTDSENSKTKRYEAEENVTKIIHGVLSRRERPMIENIQQSYMKLSEQCGDGESLNLDRLEKMGAMIQIAQMGLGALFESEWG
jgi:DNA-binding transcriptional regulator GbsR (MarR family)